ncbi:SIR2-like protein [Azospirillum baldaniorum]|uniref:SIR2 family protein n=1 Tax=Azospirillum baldaniorum TaxID=1064539 RepID=UPI0011A47B4E|nr:SIR2 family protein [Azospirillum baldaniorum]TWA60822.1 SIR2-like protein [Azospirillum baldaniorum]
MEDCLEQLDRHLASRCVAWLLGAGISFDASIPLMWALTDRVRALMNGGPHAALLDKVWAELPEGAHIEHLLSHLGDYAALAERSRSKTMTIGTLNDIEQAHRAIVGHIAEIIRWGYRAKSDTQPEEFGQHGRSLVTVAGHSAFVEALFHTQHAGLQERRPAVRLFTTNYDTLLEDALALACVPYWDGFSGGAVAFRTHRFGEAEPDVGHRAHVVKLHGSIDWYLGPDGKVWRVRDGDTYPSREARVLIHPQSTKYVATQRDPFAAQFDLFRRTLARPSDNVLAVCGYSFGDDHINQEIELALERPENKSTLIAFCREGDAMPACLTRWRSQPWKRKLFILTEKGIYAGGEGPYYPSKTTAEHGWWTFKGVTRLLRDGAGEHA